METIGVPRSNRCLHWVMLELTALLPHCCFEAKPFGSAASPTVRRCSPKAWRHGFSGPVCWPSRHLAHPQVAPASKADPATCMNARVLKTQTHSTCCYHMRARCLTLHATMMAMCGRTIPWCSLPTAVERVRLQDGPDYASGRLEVYVNGQWGTVRSTGQAMAWLLPDLLPQFKCVDSGSGCGAHSSGPECRIAAYCLSDAKTNACLAMTQPGCAWPHLSLS